LGSDAAIETADVVLMTDAHSSLSFEVSNKILNQLDSDCIQPKTSLLWIILGLRIGLFSIELGTAIWNHSLSLRRFTLTLELIKANRPRIN
jgi:cation transport ATPase